MKYLAFPRGDIYLERNGRLGVGREKIVKAENAIFSFYAYVDFILGECDQEIVKIKTKLVVRDSVKK